jgi:hypothetical protein
MGKLTNASDQTIRVALPHFAPRYDNVPDNIAMLERLFFKAVKFSKLQIVVIGE